ncbi:MAG: DUF3833 family protein [Pseudomonadota bacterium]
MSLTRRALLVSAPFFVAGCATRPPSPTPPTVPITLVDAFIGETVGRGLFSVPIAGIERGFDARLSGSLSTVNGRETLTIVEDFFFDDGETDRLTWVFTRTGPNSWDGVREDTVGVATVVESGEEVRLDYVADVVSRGETTRLGFADVIFRRPDGLVINEAVVTRFGLPIGSVRFELSQS